MDKTIAFGPASVANLGPFYDVMGYCLDHLGDIVVAEKTDKHSSVKLVKNAGYYKDSLQKEKLIEGDNCVEIMADEIWCRFSDGCDFGVNLTLHKNMPIRSGVGSSSASCVATTKALLTLLNKEPENSKLEVAEWMVQCEHATTKHFYPDNIVPSYWGGFFLISQQWLQEVNVKDFYTLIILRGEVDTAKARDAVDDFFNDLVDRQDLPEEKREEILRYMRFQSSSAARLTWALMNGKFDIAGKCISESDCNFLEQCRKGKIKDYQLIKETAIKYGAYGASISGSGPSVFAMVGSYEKAQAIRDTIAEKLKDDSFQWLISPLNRQGAIILDDPDAWIEENRVHHNFWG